MFLKFILLGIMSISFFLIGEEIYRFYKRKYKDIEDLIKIVELLNMELKFGLYTLSELFKSAGEKREFNISHFFESISIKLEDDKDLNESINESIYLIREKTNLNTKSIDEIVVLIQNLGKSDFEAQERVVNLCIENLKIIKNELYEDINQKGLLYKKISLVSGLLLVIILI